MTVLLRQNQRALLLVGILIVVVFVTYRHTFASMFSVWLGSNTYLHGILILPMSTYLVWRDRSTWMQIEFRRSLLGLAVLVLCLATWWTATLVSVQIVAQFAFVGMLAAAIWTILGTEIVRYLHFPLLFAFFSVPFGEFLIPRLMDWTADITVVALRLSGIPVLRDGNYFALPSGNFQVIEACSGIRFLIVTAVLGLYYAHETFLTWKKRLLFMLFALLAIVAANWTRAYIVVLVAHLSGMKYGTGQDHIYLGWLIFLIVIVSMFWFGRKYQDHEDRSVECGPRGVSTKANRPTLSQRSYEFGVVLLAFAFVLAGPGLADSAHRTGPTQTDVAGLPELDGSWNGPALPEFGFRPGFVGASSVLAGRYHHGSQDIEIFIFSYAGERQGSELVGWRNTLTGDSRWELLRSGMRSIDIAATGLRTVAEALIHDGQRALRVWYWYDIGGTWITEPRTAKLHQAWNAITGNRSGDAAIVVMAPESDLADEDAVAIIRSFVMTNHGHIRACLRHDGAGNGTACVSRPFYGTTGTM